MTIKDNKLLITTDPKTIYFDLPENIDNYIKHEINFISKHSWFLVVHTRKMKLVYYCPKISMEMIFMNTENSKTNEPHKFVLNLTERLVSRNSNKHVAHQNLSNYYTRENIRQQYKSNKIKIIAPAWSDEFELPDRSYSDIQDYIQYIIKNKKNYLSY